MVPVIFFDVDGVILRGQSQLNLVLFLYKKRMVALPQLCEILWAFLIYKLGLPQDLEVVRRKATGIFKGMRVDHVNALIREFYVQELRPRLIGETLALVKKHQAQGDVVVLVSASLSNIVQLIADQLKIHHVIATRLEVIDEVCTGGISGIPPYSKNKRLLTQSFLTAYNYDWTQTTAYADHITDQELLGAVRHPYVVNPDEKFRKFAADKGWPVLDLK